MNIYKGQFNRVMKKAIRSHAAGLQLSDDQVQFLMRLQTIDYQGNQATIPLFNFMVRHKPEEESVQISDIVGKLDFFNVADLVPPFVLKSLLRMCQDFDIETGKISVMVVLDKNEVRLFLYKGGECVKQLADDDIFSNETMAEIAQDNMQA